MCRSSGFAWRFIAGKCDCACGGFRCLIAGRDCDTCQQPSCSWPTASWAASWPLNLIQRIVVPCFAIAGLFLVAGIAAAVQGQQESAPLLAVARIAPGGPDAVEVVLQAVPLEASPSLAHQVSKPRPGLALFVSIRKLCVTIHYDGSQIPPPWAQQPRQGDQLQCLVNGQLLSTALPPDDQLQAGAPLLLSYGVGANDQPFNLDTLCLR
jgi:hypothetical protein